MCVILDIDPGKSIPADMLDTACDINKHGFGVSWLEGDKLVTERDTADNDPRRIADILQKLKDNRIFLHLRHATKGAVIPENSHPFLGCDKTFGFMHNGTLYDWTPTDEKYSDSKCFFDCMVHPLAAMSRKYSGPDWLKKNKLFHKIVTDYCKGMSMFVFYDNLGNTFRVNEKNGKQYEGFWASNEYSFKKSHYRSSWGANDSSPFVATPSTGQRGTLWTPSQMDLPGVPVSFTNGNKVGSVSDFFEEAHAAAASKPGQGSRVMDKAWEIQTTKYWLEQQKPKGDSVMATAKVLDAPRKSFQAESGYPIDEIMDRFSERDLETLAENFPKAAAALIVDLFISNKMLTTRLRIASNSTRGDEELIA